MGGSEQVNMGRGHLCAWKSSHLRSVENKPGAGWIDRLASRWNVAPSRVLIILVVFACTGLTVMFLKRPVVAWATDGGGHSLRFTLLYYLLILPFYNVVLLVYGALFGQFRFFWEFEKRFFARILGRKRS